MAAKSTLGDVLFRFGETMKEELKKAIDQKNLFGSGQLRQSIDFTTQVFGQTYTFKLFFLPPADEYASAMDKGATFPGKQPPIEPIIKWIAQKGIPVQDIAKKRRARTLTALKNRKPRKGLKELSSKQAARSLAFAIAKSIKKKGIKGTGFWSETVTPEVISDLKTSLSKALKRDVEIEISDLRREITGKG